MNKPVLGIDLGGTSIKAVVFNNGQQLSEIARIETPSKRGAQSVIDHILELVGQIHKKYRLNFSAVGIGSPGILDINGDITGEAVNIKGWNGFSLKETLEDLLKKPVFVANDVNLTALGEAVLGIGKFFNNILCISLGTGVGGGIVTDGEIYNGFRGAAGEVGHIIVEPGDRQCNCGLKGCLETYASATGIVRSVEQYKLEFDSPLSRIVTKGEDITSEDVYMYLSNNDPLAEKAYDIAGLSLAKGIGAASSVIAPDAVILCGGVMTDPNPLMKRINKYLPDYLLSEILNQINILPGLLGPDAGVLGAALSAQIFL